jgi:hypothetical protein
MEVYEIINTSPEFKTVYDFIADNDSPAFGYINDLDNFLNVKSEDGSTSNRDSIESKYITNADIKLKGKSAKELPLKLGTRLFIEPQKVNKAGLLTEGLEITDYDIPAFKAKALADLEAKETYNTTTFNKFSKGSLKQTYPDMTVWIWCRALANASNNYQGEILNITPFLDKCTTDVSKVGGQFQIGLPPIVCEQKSDGTYIIKKTDIKFYGKNQSSQQTDFLAQGALYEEKNGELKRNLFLFHTVLSAQDLVFIRFETLNLEKEQRVIDSNKLTVPNSSLPNRIYDMIGLIDQNGISIQSSSTDVSISIQGRDLAKIFIEDGAYVFNYELTKGMLGGPGSSGNKGLSQRLIEDKSFQYLNLYFNNTIEKVIKFVFSQLTNIKVVPDNLFSFYVDENGVDRRNYVYESESEKSTRKQDDITKYRIEAKQAIRNTRQQHNIYAGAADEETIKIDSIYQEFHRFLSAIREKNVRVSDLTGATVSWSSFDYINERGVVENITDSAFPDYFNENLYSVEVTSDVDRTATDAVDKVITLEKTKLSDSPLHKKPAPGIWQIIKLALDTNVTGRRIIDSSLSTANGSLLNFFRKICQEPFVEMLMDTYGDMYYITVRKPPTDRSGILSMLSARVNVEGQGESSKTTEAASELSVAGVIDIEASDVLVEELNFSDEEAISWYHLQPQANFLGGDEFSLAFLPAIFLPEYAEIWGSRPMQLQHNYLPTTFKDTDRNTLDIVYKQAVEDLRYIIESNSYLPFTRKGMIKINGDRRCKVGNIIRYKPTGEIFHIDHVKNDFSINDKSIERVTTLMVSRGMVEQLIYGIPSRESGGTQSYISYFNIVDTKPVYEYVNSTEYTSQVVKTGRKKVSSESIPISPIISNNELLVSGNYNTELLFQYPPETKGVFVNFINEINKLGFKVSIESGVRSYEKQLALFKKRDANNPVAAPGSKYGHEAGRAIDLHIYGSNVSLGKASPSIQWVQSGIVTLAERLGLSWGGYYSDNNHFQIKKTTTESKDVYEDVYATKRVPVAQSALDIGKIFSNFKVNKEVFNFFLNKLQLSSDYVTVKQKGIYVNDGIKNLPEIIIKSHK